MSRLIALITVLLLSLTAVRAELNVESMKGAVTRLESGRAVPLKTGARLSASDILVIPAGASVDIHDNNAKKPVTYTCTTTGENSVSKLIADALRAAKSNGRAIHEHIRVTKADDNDGVVFVEKGKVTRSLHIYDPAAFNLKMDADRLSKKLYALLPDPEALASLQPDAEVLSLHSDDGALSFMVENTLDSPVYFNVFKISGIDGSVSISELGQPVGCYAILPSQFLAREQTQGLNAEEVHILIMTDFYFDIDEVLGGLNKLIETKAPAEGADSTRLYILPL